MINMAVAAAIEDPTMPISPESTGEPVPQNLYTTDVPGVARVVSNVRLTPEPGEDIRHLVLDTAGLDFRYIEGQSLGVQVPGLRDKGHGSQLRFYSIASSRGGEDGRGDTLALCVKRARKLDPATGAELPSATGQICALKPGDELAICGPFGQGFVLPENPASNLILVATGTGMAPFRGFLRRLYRERGDWTGQVRLFSGTRTAAEAVYREEVEGYRSHAGFGCAHAFSQEEQTADGHRMHVHHRMAEQLDDLWRLLDDPATYLYLCGLKGMEEPIERLLEERAKRDGISWRACHRMLQDTGRLRVETY